MQDSEITIGTKVVIKEAQQSAPLNGAVAVVVEIRDVDHTPLYLVEVYDAQYWYRAYDLAPAQS